MDLHGKTVAFVGCGAMGSALLQGLLESSPCEDSKDEKGATALDRPFIACTKTAKSATLLAEAFSQYNARVRVVHGEAAQAAKEVDVVILGFKPFMVKGVFAVPGFLDALEGKLVVSMLAGLTCSELQALVRIHDGTPSENKRSIHFARALPTIACRHRQSMTILESSGTALSTEHAETLERLFGSVGAYYYLAPHLMNIGSMLATASLATLSIPIEGLLDGAVAEGLRRSEARDILIQGLEGLVSLLKNGEHPAGLREKMSSPRGGTIQSLVTVEKAGVRGTFAEAVMNGSRQFSKPM